MIFTVDNIRDMQVVAFGALARVLVSGNPNPSLGWLQTVGACEAIHDFDELGGVWLGVVDLYRTVGACPPDVEALVDEVVEAVTLYLGRHAPYDQIPYELIEEWVCECLLGKTDDYEEVFWDELPPDVKLEALHRVYDTI